MIIIFSVNNILSQNNQLDREAKTKSECDDAVPEHVKSSIQQEEEVAASRPAAEHILSREDIDSTSSNPADCCPNFKIDLAMLPPTDPSGCQHVYCETWGDKLNVHRLPSRKGNNYPDIYQRETEKKKALF
jgi:hypothetical protein